MGETKEEKATRLALEAEAAKSDELPADDANNPKDDPKAPNAAEANEGDVAEAVPSHLQEVVLNDESPSVTTNTHTIFHAFGTTEFVNGVANVNPDVAAHLKESGQIK